MGTYSVGARVTCVNDVFDLSDPIIRSMAKPKKDITYTIRECEEGMVRLEEIVNDEIPMDFGGMVFMTEPGFAQNRFAPLLDDRNELTESLLESIGIEKEELEYIEIEEVGVV